MVSIRRPSMSKITARGFRGSRTARPFVRYHSRYSAGRPASHNVAQVRSAHGSLPPEPGRGGCSNRDWPCRLTVLAGSAKVDHNHRGRDDRETAEPHDRYKISGAEYA